MIMQRLDKIISSQGQYSRSEVKKLVKQGLITLNGKVITSSDIKVDPESADIKIDGKSLFYLEHIYIMLNKPKGVISATTDPTQKTVIDLVPKELRRDGLFPAGRLDGDTTGFVLITDDGDFAHKILSPKNHIMKTYYATLKRNLTDEEKAELENGITLSDGTKCMNSTVKMLSSDPPVCEIQICEGKYHQVKRMFAAANNRVLELKRVKMGKLFLDEALAQGECRLLSDEEVSLIQSI